MMLKNNKQRGIIKLILTIVLGIFILSYFNVDVREFWNNNATSLRAVLGKIWQAVITFWHKLAPFFANLTK